MRSWAYATTVATILLLGPTHCTVCSLSLYRYFFLTPKDNHGSDFSTRHRSPEYVVALPSSAILHNSVLRNSETNAMQILIKLFQTRIVMMMHEPPVIQATLHNFFTLNIVSSHLVTYSPSFHLRLLQLKLRNLGLFLGLG